MSDSGPLAAAAPSYRIRRSHRARHGRIIVRPSGVEVVAPLEMPAARIHAFVQEKSDWVQRKSEQFRRQLTAAAAYLPACYASGATILYRGEPVQLQVLGAKRRGASVKAEHGRLIVTLPRTDQAQQDQRVRSALEQWFRSELRQLATSLAARYAFRMGVRVREIRVKNQRHIWGSCGPTGIINLNWRLACAPERVVEYVVVHELSHLVHRDHSRAFWALVERYQADYRINRRWLRDHDVVLSRALT